MTILSKAEVDNYLRWAGELGRDAVIVDMHVHATEVIRAGHTYTYDTGTGVYARDDRAFTPPATTKLVLRDEYSAGDAFTAATRNQVSAMLFERAYDHTGPAVLSAEMALANIDTALLLPVARPGQSISDQMAVLRTFRDADDRFHLSYSVPDTIPDQDISVAVRQAVADFGIRAVKLHPNLSNLDPESEVGRERTLAIIAACDAMNLPLIVHGGRSPILGDSAAAEHAVLEKLDTIEWSGSKACVVVSHFGVYGFRGEEIARQGKRLNALLARHANMVTDTSGVDYAVLTSLLPIVDPDRILYGSDAMYTPMWKSVVQLLRALETVEADPESAFLKIASTNPRRHLGL
jgi:predicted TIM-barrel fold metal-dependent hydrolase